MTYSQKLGRAPGYMGTGRRVPSITWTANTFKDPVMTASSGFAALIITEASKLPPSKRKAMISSVLERVKPGTAADASGRKAKFIREGKNENQATFDGMRLAIANAAIDRLIQAGKDKAAGKPVQGLGLGRTPGWYPWDPWERKEQLGRTPGWYPWDPWERKEQGISGDGLGGFWDDAWKGVKGALCVTGAVAGTITGGAGGSIAQGQSAIGCNAAELKTQRDVARLQSEQQASMERMRAAELASKERTTNMLIVAGGIGAALLITVVLFK